MDCFDHIGISHTERDNGKERTAKLVRIRVRLHRAAQLGLVEMGLGDVLIFAVIALLVWLWSRGPPYGWG